MTVSERRTQVNAQALIEEARRYYDCDHCAGPSVVLRLADALEASEAAREVEVDDMHVALIATRIKHNDLRHGIAALADEMLALVSGDSRERSDG